MQINKISITKSKTIGTLSNMGRSSFKKVMIQADCKLAEGDDHDKSYEELSTFIDNKFEWEKTNNK